MKISLSEFEHQINETILKRGFNYYKRGHVTDVEELDDGEYEITVEGSEIYTVNLKVKGDVVTYFECDCPYDMGPVCKHVVAALFYLQKDILATLTSPTEKTKKRPKEKSVLKQADELLETLSHNELKSFVRNVCVSDKKFRQLLVAKHIHILSPASKELYAEQIRVLVNTYSDKYGFIDYSATFKRTIEAMANDAKKNLNEGQPRLAMFIALAIAEEMVQVLNYGSDDSDGKIVDCIEDAYEILKMLTEMDLDEALHDELFDHLIRLFEENIFKGWDWHFHTIGLAIEFLKKPQEKERIKAVLDKIKPNGNKWDWDYSQAQELSMALIQKTESADSVIRYMEKNISNSNFRAKLIEIAIEAKDYSKAKIIAEEGVIKEANGSADQWRNYLLTIARKTCDTENTIRFARYFLVHSDDRYHSPKYYYNVLKDLIPSAQWPEYLENLIIEINSKSDGFDYDRISKLYIWEAQWDQLLELIRQHANFDRIAQAERYLDESYSEKLAILYNKLILAYLKRNIGRNHYQIVCRYIRRMIKLGAQSMATNLIKELKNTYPTRRALIEELNKI
ncbi:MAG: hypothetical protein LBP34_03975 [Flavobacteriaceae bacterium]|jgi:hypothetical protein|nr:hypothetical protein [Flavobacteriaceae bacterium]